MQAALIPFPTKTGPSAQKLDAICALITGSIEEMRLDLDVRTFSPGESLKDVDLLIVLGSDRDVLKASQDLGDISVPMLGVSDFGGGGFLTDATTKTLPRALEKITRGEYRTEECSRLGISIDGLEAPFALNEVAVFPSKSAVLMEYTLMIDGQDVYRDYSDGVLVATPTGSSAYAMSAGGPLVLPLAKVFLVVSVNSMDIARRPLVVPDSSVIEIGEVSSRSECEVVVDGLFRARVEDSVRIRKGPPTKIVRLDGKPPKRIKTIRKIHLMEELMKMPPSAKLVLKAIEYEGPLTQKDIIGKTLLPPRTVRHAISILLRKGMITSSPLMRDLRADIYYISAPGKEERLGSESS